MSVEGQIAVEYFNPSTEWQGKKYMFKCHRQMVNGEGYVWPVNSLAFHLVCIAHVCLCTVASRQRLTLMQTQHVHVGGWGQDGVDLGPHGECKVHNSIAVYAAMVSLLYSL